MVQDMLESQYFCSPSLEYGMTEQTRLVLVPVPTTTAAATTTTTTGSMDTEEAIISEQHRDKRLKQQQTQKAVLGQLYYEQYQQQQQQQQQQECEMPIIQNKLCLNDLVEFVGVWQAATDHEEEESTPRSNASMDHDDDDDDDDDVWMNHPNHYHPNNSNLSSMLDIPHRMMMYNHEEQETSTCSSPITHNQQLAARFHILWYRRLESLEQATNSFMSSSSSSSLLKQQEVLVAAVPNDAIVFHHHHDSIPSILARALHLDSSSTITAHAVWMTLLSMAERSSPPAASTTTTSSSCSSSSSSSSSRPITTPHDTTLGCASLHMALQDVTACRTMQLQLQHVLSQIVPFVQVMDLSSSSSSSSSTGSFFSDTVASVMTPPHKQQGRLQPTPLQMPMGSTLILNIGDGSFLKQCASNGSTNNNNNNNSLLLYQALQELTLHHRMPYRFDGGMQLYFEADVRVIVLSTTTSSTTINSNDRTGFSLLPCTLQVACQFSPQDGSNSSNSNSGSHDEANVHENETILLQQVRHYLAKARCRKFQANNNIRLPQAVLEQAQKDFLERRQQQQQQPIGNKSDALVGEDDLHRWLTITRLQARSRQASEASLDDWQRAVELDDAIKESFRP